MVHEDYFAALLWLDEAVTPLATIPVLDAPYVAPCLVEHLLAPFLLDTSRNPPL
jgi:hypothetical protein